MIAALMFALGSALTAGRVHADTLFIEAEGAGENGHPLSEPNTKITSPFLINNDSSASLGRYLTVASGFNSTSAPPSVEGVATYRFTVGTAGTYRIWGRVIAPTTSDDSFWVRVTKVGSTSSTLVNWNGIDPGASWHWAQVKPSGASAPSPFTLEAGARYELQISYREDGTKLDLLVITNDTTFNPKSPPTTAPPAPPPGVFDAPTVVPRMLSAGATTGIRVFWSEVPGAKSYTLKRSVNGDPVPDLTGLTGHIFTETSLPANGGSNCYDVLAVFPDGTSRNLDMPSGVCESLHYEQTFLDTAGTLTGSAPMVVDEANNSAYTKAGTPSSTSAPPAHGRVRFDFEVGGPAKLQFWFQVDTTSPTNPNDKTHDSFWARVDNGTWIKWNNIINAGCAPVHNSDAGDAPVTFSVAAGTHRFELATRETGTVSGVPLPLPSLENIFFITDNLHADANTLCSD